MTHSALPLANRVAIVTGGASGIGKAIVSALCADGASVAIIDKNESLLNHVAETLRENGFICNAYPFDLSQHKEIPALVDSIHQAFGRIDMLVNSAGLIDSGRTLLDIDESTWDLIHDVNLKAPLFLMQAVAKRMIQRGEGGRIVNVTSSSAFRAVMSYPAYGSSKAGLTQLTRSAAAELGAYDINVNCVAPGVTVTPLVERIAGLAGTQKLSEEGPLANLLKRPSLPEDVASVVRFLCLPESRQITGQTIHTSAGAIV
jgi:NAD(P)-dependent dehydrogenase (short-subunit alcohol dehydrogenase family)